jgi:hypothetical protein
MTLLVARGGCWCCFSLVRGVCFCSLVDLVASRQPNSGHQHRQASAKSKTGWVIRIKLLICWLYKKSKTVVQQPHFFVSHHKQAWHSLAYRWLLSCFSLKSSRFNAIIWKQFNLLGDSRQHATVNMQWFHPTKPAYSCSAHNLL